MSLSWTVVMPECGDNSIKIEQNILQKLLKLDIYIYIFIECGILGVGRVVGVAVERWGGGEQAGRGTLG